MSARMCRGEDKGTPGVPMRILQSDVAMAAFSSHDVTSERTTTLDIRQGNPTASTVPAAAPTRVPTRPPEDLVILSREARRLQDAGIETATADNPLSGEDFRLLLEILILEKLWGQRIRTCDADDFSTCEGEAARAPTVPSGDAPVQAPALPSFSVTFTQSETTVTAESTSFQARGAVTTADGRQISFQTALEMARVEVSHTRVEVRIGNAPTTDPLILNLDGSPAALSEDTFAVDLDEDGTAEDVRWTEVGHGYLVLDRDGDGAITRGSELFGPTSGDGFVELAREDADANGWIDEADPVFARLRILGRDASGTTTLQSLQDAGVGAIGLSRVATPFTLRDAAGEDAGLVRTTGVFLEEDGGVGTVQQVDFLA